MPRQRQHPHYTRRALVAFATMAAVGESFVPQTSVRELPGSTSLNLLPQQGKQLVAAYEASTCNKEAREMNKNGYHHSEAIEDGLGVKKGSTEVPQQFQRTPTGAARAFVSRVFKLPSNIRQNHQHHEEEEGWTAVMSLPKLPRSTKAKDDKPEVLLYPLVGFRIVEDEEHHFRGLPTKSNVSCRINDNEDEELYGWFSAGCRLNLYKEDPCEAPTAVAPSVLP